MIFKVNTYIGCVTGCGRHQGVHLCVGVVIFSAELVSADYEEMATVEEGSDELRRFTSEREVCQIPFLLHIVLYFFL